HSHACPKDCFWRSTCLSSRRPGDSEPRTKVLLIIDRGYGFISQAEAQGQIGLNAPVVQCIEADIELTGGSEWISSRDGKLRCASAERPDPRSRVSQTLKQQRTPVLFKR